MAVELSEILISADPEVGRPSGYACSRTQIARFWRPFLLLSFLAALHWLHWFRVEDAWNCGNWSGSLD
jgi:hypothetical protein